MDKVIFDEHGNILSAPNMVEVDGMKCIKTTLENGVVVYEVYNPIWHKQVTHPPTTSCALMWADFESFSAHKEFNRTQTQNHADKTGNGWLKW